MFVDALIVKTKTVLRTFERNSITSERNVASIR